MAEVQHSPTHFALVAIDLGTTYSGIAYTIGQNDGGRPCFPSRPDISPVSNWPVIKGLGDDLTQSLKIRPKVPSTLIIDKHLGKVDWGYEAILGVHASRIDESVEPPLQWLKLLICEPDDFDEDLKHYAALRSTRDRMAKIGRKPVEVAGVFLRCLWQHARQQIIQASNLGDTLAFLFVFASPACWQPKSQAAFKEAIWLAGIHEAAYAASQSLHVLRAGIKRTDLKDGEGYIVVDIGGATADFSGYLVNNASRQEIRQCARHRCTLVDARFRMLLKSVMNRVYGDQTFETLTPQAHASIMEIHWMKRKERFDGSKIDREEKFPFQPNINDNNGNGGTCEIAIPRLRESDGLQGVHISRIAGQRRRRPVEWDSGWAATSLGGVVCGLQDLSLTLNSPIELPTIVPLVSMASFGITARVMFDDAKHDPDGKTSEWSHTKKLFLAQENIWIVQKGAAISFPSSTFWCNQTCWIEDNERFALIRIAISTAHVGEARLDRVATTNFAELFVDMDGEGISRQSLEPVTELATLHRNVHFRIAVELFADDTVVLSVAHNGDVLTRSPRVSVAVRASPYVVHGIA
ncbi:Fc.00g037410.m01.CDS01 [Cosmosporella sp. VM-42]